MLISMRELYEGDFDRNKMPRKSNSITCNSIERAVESTICVVDHTVCANRVRRFLQAWRDVTRFYCSLLMLLLSISSFDFHPSLSLRFGSVDGLNHQFQLHSLLIHPYESGHSSWSSDQSKGSCDILNPLIEG